MKSLLALMFFSAMTLAHAAIESADYHISKGSLHKGGTARIEIEKTWRSITAKLSYHIDKRFLVPIPKKVLTGETVIEMPPEFKDERGYKKLEELGVMDTPRAKLQFVRRLSWNGLSDAVEFLILPKNGKSRIDVIYHPSIAAAGWAQVVITFISEYPILNGYKAEVNIN